MELDDLEDLFDDLDIDGPTPEQLFQMYGIFLRDIVRNPLIVNGTAVRYNNNPSRHPVCKGKVQTFEHIITRESKYSKKRNFDHMRANKIHWIRPIIENVSSTRVKYFERINDEGQLQLFYWFEEKSHLIIIRNVEPGLLLITSFCIDYGEKGTYKNWYLEYEKAKKNPTS